MGAVAIVLFMMRGTMKNMKYFIRPEHFDGIGKLMLVIAMGWGYFFFNDYLVPWYGGDIWADTLNQWLEKGPMAWMFFSLLILNVVIPFSILWRKKWRSTPWILASVGLCVNIGMYFERYLIFPVGLTINRMPFTWRLYHPRIEIPLTIGTFSLFLLLYMIASRLIPLVPVWEVQEGQIAHRLIKVGKSSVPAVSHMD
jgi:molybdopterin-containing oxidoreductase family membrane subunit